MEWLNRILGRTKGVSEELKALKTHLSLIETGLHISGDRLWQEQMFLGYARQLTQLTNEYYALREKAYKIAEGISKGKENIPQSKIDRAVGVIQKDFTDFINKIQEVQSKIEAAAKRNGIEAPKQTVLERERYDGRYDYVEKTVYPTDPQLDAMRTSVKRVENQGVNYGDKEVDLGDWGI